MFKSAILVTSLLLGVSAPGIDTHAQACGFSINTIFVEDGEGKPIRNAHLIVSRKDPNDDYNPHFTEVSKAYWSEERNAHVYQHGLCGSHRDLILRISAEGFDTLEHPIDLPLGWQAFVVTLRRNGTGGSGAFRTLSCTDGTTVCVKTVKH